MPKHDLKQKKFAMLLGICVPVIITLTVLFIIPKDLPAENNKPIAIIDGTLNVKVGNPVYLDGTLSSDPGGANLDYSWTLLSSPNSSLAIIASPSDPQASFTADIAGTYKVKLIVNNGSTDSTPAYAEIIVTE
jgi:chitinase